MNRFRVIISRVFVSGVLLLLVGTTPSTALADTTAPNTDTATPSSTTPASTTTPPSSDPPAPVTSSPTTPATPKPGPTKPNGADANTYHFNATTGMWENAYYIWNPATGQTQPKTPQTYSYNPATGRWDTTQWVYDAASGTYKPNTLSVSQPPAGAPTIGGPTTAAAITTPTAAIATAGNSTPTPNAAGTNTSNGTFDLFYNAAISNNLSSTATSGDASVTSNTLAGNATSGNAAAIATLVNLLQSTASFADPQNTVAFTTDVQGTVTGDLVIDPTALAKQLNTTNATVPSGNLTVNASGGGQINNDISLAATSGSATVASNTTAGNATSGNAAAVANIVNLLNSAISSGKSFVGVVNIYGNLDGDILLPPGLLTALLASNSASPSATSTADKTLTTNNVANVTTNQSINNQISTASTTGNATVSQNTTAGSATSGNALSNITILNLTGSNIIGSNDLLVFVNVLGKWVGAIVNAPTGATAAELGGGITSNGTIPMGTNTTVDATTNEQINNNILLSATSGDATVTHNTTAGNATTGNATTSANLLNITGSTLSFSNWFGILFINVFGTWYGSFGVNTSAGNLPGSPVSHPQPASSGTTPQVFRFVPTQASQSAVVSPITTTPTTMGSSVPPTEQLASSRSVPGTVLGGHITIPPTDTPHTFSISYWVPALGLFIGASLFTTERVLSRRQSRRSGSLAS